jgi:hypothetical protein
LTRISSQDALDLITGSWKIRRGTPSPFADDRLLSIQVVRAPAGQTRSS